MKPYQRGDVVLIDAPIPLAGHVQGGSGQRPGILLCRGVQAKIERWVKYLRKKACPLNHLPRKEKCAWWDEDTQECAILALARAVKKVTKNVR